MPDKIRVVIADDHAVVREGLRSFLGIQDDIEIVAEASDGEEAVRQVEVNAPDVVVMDLVMPRVEGVEAIRRIRTASPDVKIIVLTSFADDEKMLAAVRAGATGYLLKDAKPQELSDAIRAANRGEALVHPAVAARLMQEVAARDKPSPADALTPRELEVLRLMVRGLPNKQIARELEIAEKTVKTHVSNILRKLDLQDRTQAVVYALRERIVDID